MAPAKRDEISPRVAAARLGVHVKTVRRWCHEQRIRYRRDLGRRIWISEAEIDQIQPPKIQGTQGTEGAYK